MPDAKKRRSHMEHLFAGSSLIPVFLDACVGVDVSLPNEKYNELAYQRAHGKTTNLSEIGCYFSHLRALEVFLESKDDYALIMEDDVSFAGSLEQVLDQALMYHERFDLLRLSGLHKGTPVKIVELSEDYNLACCYSRQTGSGAYLVNRYAATKMLKYLSPMWLPYDHAFDREWCWGVKSMCIDPMPVLQNGGFKSQINASESYKLPLVKRYITVFPYRAWNELNRVVFRSIQIVKNKIQNKRMGSTAHQR